MIHAFVAFALCTGGWARAGEDPANGMRVQVQTAHPGYRARSVRFSADGRFALTVGYGMALRDAQTGVLLRSWPAQTDILDAAFGEDAVIVAATPTGVRRYDAATGAALGEKAFPAAKGAHEQSVMSADGGVVYVDDNVLIGDDPAWIVGGGATRAVQRTQKNLSLSFPAMSADGRRMSGCEGGVLAIDTTTGRSLFSIPTGRLAKSAWSADGRVLVVETSPTMALMAVDGDTGRPLGTKRDVKVEGRLYAVSRDGQLVLYAADGGMNPGRQLAIWDRTANTVQQLPSDLGCIAGAFDAQGRALCTEKLSTWLYDPGERRLVWRRDADITVPRSIAFSPDGRRLAVIGETLAVWDLDRLAPVRQVSTPEGYRVRWSADGSRLLSTTDLQGGAKDEVVVWDPATLRPLARVDADGGFPTAVFAADGTVVFEVGNAVRHWNPATGAVRQVSTDVTFGLSAPADGRVVVFKGAQLWRWEPTVAGSEPSLVELPPGWSDYGTGLSDFDDLAFSPDGSSIALSYMGIKQGKAGKVVVVKWPSLERMWSAPGGPESTPGVYFSPDSRTVAVAAGGSVTVYDATNGTKLYTQPLDGGGASVTPGGELLAVGATPGVELVATGSGERLTLLTRAPSTWVAIAPDGTFDATRDGGELVARVDGLEAYGIEQFAAAANRPDVLLTRLGLGNSEVIAHYGRQVELRRRRLGLGAEADPARAHAPTARLETVGQEARTLTVRVTGSDAEDALVSGQVWVNGVPVEADPRKIEGNSATFTLSFPLHPGENVIEASVTDARGMESHRARTTVRWEGRVDRRLFYAGVGVSAYRNASYNLGFAHQDALDLAEVLGREQGFTEVRAKTWTDAQATRGAFDEVEAFLADAGPDDRVVLFLAGHGLHARDDAEAYYFLTHEADPRALAKTAVPFERIEEILRKVPSREKLALVDTCESGEVDDTVASLPPLQGARGVARGLGVQTKATAAVGGASAPRPWLWDRERYLYQDLARRTGAVVFSSSRGGEPSYESEELRNGYFTEELVRALTTREADADQDGALSLHELRSYVAAQVAQRTEERQHPTVDRDNEHATLAFPLP